MTYRLPLVLVTLFLASPAFSQSLPSLQDEAQPAAANEPASQISPSAAESRPSRSFDVDYNLTIATDYSTRGTSQTGGRPVVQGGVEVSKGIFYAGTWASNVDLGDSTNAEVDFYTGVRSQTAGLDWDLRALGYVYVGQPDGSEYNYAEYRASVAKQVGRTRLGAVAFYTPDYFGTTKDEALFLQTTAAHQINERWSISGAVGRQWIPGPNDHTTWHFGPSYQATESLAVDLRYYDTDAHDLGSNYEGRVVLSLKAAF